MILLYPVLTEKAVGLIEKENKITFVVNKKATKPEIKKEFEKVYRVVVEKVNTENTMNGEKRAYIKLNKKNNAADLAAKLKIM